MAEFKYETQIFSALIKEDLSNQINSWLAMYNGRMEVVSSNMVVYNDPQNQGQLTFTVYSLFIRFPEN